MGRVLRVCRLHARLSGGGAGQHSTDRGDAAQGPAALATGTHDSVLCDLEAQRGTFREFIAFDEAQVHFKPKLSLTKCSSRSRSQTSPRLDKKLVFFF